MIGAKVRGGEKAHERLARMMESVKLAGEHEVRVGVPDGKNEPGTGTPLSLVAAAHEFGVPGRIPERPFLRPGLTTNKDELRTINESLFKNVVNERMTVNEALQIIGMLAAGGVQKFIRNGSFQPLDPRTIERKGSSEPLIDTGNLIQSITSEVRSK